MPLPISEYDGFIDPTADEEPYTDEQIDDIERIYMEMRKPEMSDEEYYEEKEIEQYEYDAIFPGRRH